MEEKLSETEVMTMPTLIFNKALQFSSLKFKPVL